MADDLGRIPVPVLTDAPKDMADGLNMGNVAPLQGKNLIPDAKNWALDPETLKRAQDEVAPLINQARLDRKPVENGWDEIRRMVLMEHDLNQKYIGRSNSYLPVYSKNAQTQITALSRGLFPTDEYMSATACGTQVNPDPDADLKAKIYMQYQFEVIAHLRYHMKLFNAQLVDFGWSILKYWYRGPAAYAKARGKKISFDSMARTMSGYIPEFKKDRADQGLCVSTRSIYNFFAYPFTAASLRETTLQFEDVFLSRAQLIHLAKQQKWFTEELIRSAPSPETIGSQYNEQHAAHDSSTATDKTDAPLAVTTVLTEVYTFMELPKAAYVDDQDEPGCPLPVRILFLGNTPVDIRRNTSYTQSSPFLGLSTNARPGWMRGHGMGKLIGPLQYLANDFANQTNDVCIYGLNPIVKVIPGMMIGGVRPIAPGVIQYMNDKDAMSFDRPPVDQVQFGQSMLNMIIAQAGDFGGTPPIMQGTSSRGAGKTATGSQILQHNAAEPTQDTVEDIETEILNPLAKGAYLLAQQYAPEEILATVFGIQKTITKDDLLKEYEFTWQASSQSANAQQRASQAMQFLAQLQPLLQPLQQQGVQVDLLPLLKRVFTDAMGFRGFDEVFKRIQQMMPGAGMQGMPGQGGPPGMPPGMAGPQSTVQQAPGGGPGLPPQAGEGQAFGDVRANSDMLSSIMGGGDGSGQ